MSTRLEVTNWLADLYAMERAIELLLKKEAGNAESPESQRAKARFCLGATRHRAEALRMCRKQLGNDAAPMLSPSRSAEADVASGNLDPDERVRDILAAYADPDFQVACHIALKAAAHQAA